MGNFKNDFHNSNFTQIHNELWKNEEVSDKSVRIMLYLLDKPNTWTFNQNAIANFCKCSRSTVSRHLKLLKELGYLSIEQSNESGFSYNYALTLPCSKNATRKNATRKNATRKNATRKNATHSNTINNNTNISNTEEKNKNLIKENSNDNSRAKEVLEYLIFKTCKTYKPTKSNLTNINGRLGDGYSVDDCKRVIDNMYLEWHGETAMIGGKLHNCDDWLNPTTLFKPTKFDNRLNKKPRELTTKDLAKTMTFEEPPEGFVF